jgi:hypothetical protein
MCHLYVPIFKALVCHLLGLATNAVILTQDRGMLTACNITKIIILRGFGYVGVVSFRHNFRTGCGVTKFPQMVSGKG